MPWDPVDFHIVPPAAPPCQSWACMILMPALKDHQGKGLVLFKEHRSIEPVMSHPKCCNDDCGNWGKISSSQATKEANFSLPVSFKSNQKDLIWTTVDPSKGCSLIVANIQTDPEGAPGLEFLVPIVQHRWWGNDENRPSPAPWECLAIYCLLWLPSVCGRKQLKLCILDAFNLACRSTESCA